MAYEFLKRLYGTPKDGEAPKSMTYAELEAAIDADKKLKLVNLADGGYVPQSDYGAKETELAGVKKQLEEANATIGSYKDMDIEGVKKSAQDWEAKYNTETAALKKQLEEQARSHAEEMFLSGYQFTSKAARSGILAELQAKKLPLENGTLLGGKEFMTSLMGNEDYKGAFVPEKPTEPEPATPKAPDNLPRFSAPSGGADGNAKTPLFDFGFQQVNPKPAAQ